MHSETAVASEQTKHSTRAAGIAIVAATLVSTVAVAMDPNGGGSNALQVLQGIVNLQVTHEVVHAIAIASVCGYAFGYATLARRLGLHRAPVLAGLSFYMLGCVAMIGATILDGFVTPHIAIDAVTGSPEKVKFAYDLVYYIGTVLNDLAKLGWILQAVATMAWSYVLIRDGFSRATGVIGIASSSLVIALIAVSQTNMTMTSLLSVLLAQLIWNLAAGTMLMRQPRAAARSAGLGRPALAS